MRGDLGQDPESLSPGGIGVFNQRTHKIMHNGEWEDICGKTQRRESKNLWAVLDYRIQRTLRSFGKGVLTYSAQELGNLLENFPWAKVSVISGVVERILFQRYKEVIHDDGKLSFVTFYTAFWKCSLCQTVVLGGFHSWQKRAAGDISEKILKLFKYIHSIHCSERCEKSWACNLMHKNSVIEHQCGNIGWCVVEWGIQYCGKWLPLIFSWYLRLSWGVFLHAHTKRSIEGVAK